MTSISLDPLDLAALLCSRVCHDVISPVGAIVNGLEMLEDEKDEAMRKDVLELIRGSADNASARLQFARLAFGAAGSAGASIDTGDAEKAARGLFSDPKLKLEWSIPRVLAPKNKVKLLLNLCLLAASSAPRGGTVRVEPLSEGWSDFSARVTAKGPNVKINPRVAAILADAPEEPIDAHTIQPYYAVLVAEAAQMTLIASSDADAATFEARPAAAAREAAA